MNFRFKESLLSAGLVVALAGASSAIEPVDTSDFVKEVTAEKIQIHLQRLQELANNNEDTRAAGTDGYNASVRYVAGQLVNAGYSVELQQFPFLLFTENSAPRLVRTAPGHTVYEPGEDFLTMEYSGSGDVTAPLALAGGIVLPPTDQSSSRSGCSARHFPDRVEGKIVLVQRGFCDFVVKAQNAQDAGALGVLIFNEGQCDLDRCGVISGTLGRPVEIPVVGTTFALGNNLYQRVQNGQNVEIRLNVDATTTNNKSVNVIASRRGRVNDQTVVVGAHLDSVPEGPGINDNGSGSSAILVIAEEMARQRIRPRNTVRFAWWGAEESGLNGSNYYVSKLSSEQLARVGLNLNFDMLGSPNFVRFVYDGDTGQFGTPASGEIEDVFVDFLADRGLESEPTPFDGRSDYQAFILAGIPAGGLFSGAEGVKTPRQERIYGGRAGRPYDACYHEACDDIDNTDNKILNQFGKAAAHATLTFALTEEDIRDSGARVAGAVAEAGFEYRGPHLVR